MASLAGVTRWLVVPDGSLWGIPIGVLPDPEDPNRYLLERVTVGYLTSTYELAEASIEKGRAEGARAVAARGRSGIWRRRKRWARGADRHRALSVAPFRSTPGHPP